MLKAIKIIKTDFDSKFLLKYNENTLLVGYIVKEILFYIQNDIPKKDIINLLKENHNVEISNDTLYETISRLNHLKANKNKKYLIKILTILNPNKFKYPSFVRASFNGVIFVVFFSLSLFTNIYGFLHFTKTSSSIFLDWFLFYFFLIIILLAHEIGHSISAKNYDINTGEIGLGIYGFLPVLYIDLNESWSLNYKKRLNINLSGIYVQLLIGVFIYLFIYIFGDNFILNNLFFSNFIILLFNINPFFKFDGYWIVSDLLKENNLMSKSNKLLKSLLKFKINLKINKIFVYSILRLAFIIYLLTILFLVVYRFLSSLIFDEMKSNYIVILSVIIYFILIKILKKNELKRKKREL